MLHARSCSMSSPRMGQRGEALSDDLRRRGLDTVELLKPVNMSAELGNRLDILST